MRIAMLVSATFPPREGMGFYVWNLARQVTRRGHSVQIITRGGVHRATREIVEGITIWRPLFVPIYPFHVHFHSLFVNRLLRLLEPKLDLLHLHTPLVRFPHTHLPTLITVHTPMLADTAAIPASNLTGLLAKLQSPVSIALEKELFQRACRIVTVASSVAAELYAYHIDPHQVGVLGNGVDTDIFTPPGPNQVPSTAYFLTAGRIAPRKGLEDLIECASIVASCYPQVLFLVAGTGPFEKRLRALIARHRLEKTIILLGHISDRNKLVELYQGACAYIHPAHYEGLPTVILEAMACSKPVIATAVSGTLDVITDENNGLLVQPHSPEQLAAAAMRVLNNPSLGHQLGKAALQTIRACYTWAVVSRNYIDEYKNLLHE